MCGQNPYNGCMPKVAARLSESNQMQVLRLLPLSRLPPAQKESLTVPTQNTRRPDTLLPLRPCLQPCAPQTAPHVTAAAATTFPSAVR